MSDLRLVVTGAAGRMGRTLVQAIHAAPGVALAGALEVQGSIALGQDAGLLAGCGKMGVPITDDAAAAFKKADGLLDFTIPAASVALAALAAKAGVIHVMGTTGLTAADLTAVRAAAMRTAIVQSGNMSLGVSLLGALVRRVALSLGPEFDIEIVEMHHRAKIDAPSGTALLLGEAAAEGRGVKLADHSVRGRDGVTGARRAGDIGFSALRGGTVIGEHAVIFAGQGERIELHHKAEDRSLFANGALRAALWARGRPPGLYTMADVLGLKDF